MCDKPWRRVAGKKGLVGRRNGGGRRRQNEGCCAMGTLTEYTVKEKDSKMKKSQNTSLTPKIFVLNVA